MENVTSPLLTEVHAILGGSHEVERLSEAIDATRADLEALRADFQAAVARERDGTRRLVAREIQAVDQAFEDYGAVLDCTAGYLQGFERSYLESAARHMPLAIARLDLNFLAYREAAMAERGPTTHPGINYLAALCALALQGEDREAELEAQLELEVARADLGQQEEGGPLSEPRRQFYAAYLGHLEACAGVDQGWLDGLLALGRDYARLDLATLERRFGWNPTRIPALNLVINGVWLWSQERVAPEVCQLLLDQGHAFLLETLESHQQLAAALSASDPARDPAARATQALESLLDLLEAYHVWVAEPRPGVLEELAQEAIAAASELEEAREALQGTGASQVPCTICGLANPPGSARCTQCGSKLAAGGFETGEASAPTEEPSRVHKLLDTAAHVLQGQAEPEVVQGLVEELQQSLRVARRKAAPVDELAEDDPLRASAVSYATALDEMEAGLGELQTFADDPSHETLAKASELLLAAAEKLTELQSALSAQTP